MPQRTEILILHKVGSARNFNCFSWSLLLWKCPLFSAAFSRPNNGGSKSLSFLYLLSFGSFCDPLLPSSPAFPCSSDICWPHTRGCVWHTGWECDFTALFFSQQNVSQHVVMEVSVSDLTSASVKKDILVLSVNKWTETSAEWPGQVFLIRSLTWHLICWI